MEKNNHLVFLKLAVRMLGFSGVVNCFEWGQKFSATLFTKNTHFNCKYHDINVCCSILDENLDIYPTRKGHYAGHRYSMQNKNTTSSTSSNDTKNDKPLHQHSRPHQSSSSSNSSSSKSSKSNQGLNPREWKCTLHKTYQPSPYETLHMNIAQNLTTDFSKKEYQRRRQIVKEYIMGGTGTDYQWLQLISSYSQLTSNYNSNSSFSAATQEGNISLAIIETEKNYFLSKFIITRKCVPLVTTTAHHRANNHNSNQHQHHRNSSSNNQTQHHHITSSTTTNVVTSTWEEYIEPLTIHGRQPFAFYGYNCGNLFSRDFVKQLPDHYHQIIDIYNTDYILLQNIANLAEQAFGLLAANQPSVQHYLFDAGTSRFDSSLFWFVCSYLQRGISFDRMYGWEMTLLEPKDFWDKVPSSIAPYFHFYNAQISSNISDSLSIPRFMRQTARKEDFVSFKLDIDTPEVEIPIALTLLEESIDSLAEYVDEFFFELHFRCEIMASCGWVHHIPESFAGLQLDRFHAMELFQKIRYRGVRAHFWV